jgi:hypothetical protein
MTNDTQASAAAPARILVVQCTYSGSVEGGRQPAHALPSFLLPSSTMAAAPDSGTAELPLFSLGLTIGAIEIGILFGTLSVYLPSPETFTTNVLVGSSLYGTAIVQTYIYITSYPQDRRWIKAVVGAVWCVVLQPFTTPPSDRDLARLRRCTQRVHGHIFTT